MTWTKTAVTVILVLALGGCQAMTGRTAGQNVDDAAITASVQTQLTTERLSNFTRIDVDTNNGVVSLNGVVDSADHKQRAEQLARRVGGVKNVVNNLQVQRRPS